MADLRINEIALRIASYTNILDTHSVSSLSRDITEEGKIVGVTSWFSRQMNWIKEALGYRPKGRIYSNWITKTLMNTNLVDKIDQCKVQTELESLKKQVQTALKVADLTDITTTNLNEVLTKIDDRLKDLPEVLRIDAIQKETAGLRAKYDNSVDHTQLKQDITKFSILKDLKSLKAIKKEIVLYKKRTVYKPPRNEYDKDRLTCTEELLDNLIQNLEQIRFSESEISAQIQAKEQEYSARNTVVLNPEENGIAEAIQKKYTGGEFEALGRANLPKVFVDSHTRPGFSYSIFDGTHFVEGPTTQNIPYLAELRASEANKFIEDSIGEKDWATAVKTLTGLELPGATGIAELVTRMNTEMRASNLYDDINAPQLLKQGKTDIQVDPEKARDGSIKSIRFKCAQKYQWNIQKDGEFIPLDRSISTFSTSSVLTKDASGKWVLTVEDYPDFEKFSTISKDIDVIAENVERARSSNFTFTAPITVSEESEVTTPFGRGIHRCERDYPGVPSIFVKDTIKRQDFVYKWVKDNEEVEEGPYSKTEADMDVANIGERITKSSEFLSKSLGEDNDEWKQPLMAQLSQAGMEVGNFHHAVAQFKEELFDKFPEKDYLVPNITNIQSIEYKINKINGKVQSIDFTWNFKLTIPNKEKTREKVVTFTEKARLTKEGDSWVMSKLR